MKIVADENIPGLSRFAGIGEIARLPGRELSAADLVGADILLVRSVTPVNRELLHDSPVRFVGTATIGVDHVDLDYLAARGIAFASAPGSNARSVAEYVLCCLSWLHLQGRLDLDAVSVGIIGLGNVGTAVYDLLTAIDIPARACDPLIPQDSHPALDTWEQVINAEVLCLHTPLTTGGSYPTYHLLGAAALALLPAGQVLLNAGRGGVVDNQALRAALAAGQDLVPVLDVWEQEPAIDIGLLPYVALATPHIAGYSHDGKVAATRMLFEAVCRWLDQSPQPAADELGPRMLAPTFTGTEREQLARLLLGAYDVRGDDRRLRQALALDATGAAFDRLRKHYPRRREFPAHVLSTRPGSSRVQRWLDGLGFRFSLEC